MLYFLEIIQLLVEEAKRYYQKYLDILNGGQSPLPNVTIQEKYSFLAITVQMEYNQKDILKACWSTAEQFSMLFYRNMIKQSRFLHTLRFLHFKNKPDKT
jgi:hypothetical protein